MDMLKAISALTTTPGVSGDEWLVGDAVAGYFREYTSDVWRDTAGNTCARIGDASKPTLLVMAHMDEIGMIVTAIEDNGMLRVASVAGVDPRVLPGSEVLVMGCERVKAAVGALPPHLLKSGEENNAYKIEDLTCDTGFSPERVKELVSVGDFVTFTPLEPLELKNNIIAGKTFDDRALVVAMIEVMDILKNYKLNCNVVFCASVQEERGSIGAEIGTYNVKPDMAIAIDVCHAPTPGTPQFSTVPLEKVAVTVGSNIHPKMAKLIKESASSQNIEIEVDAAMGHTGTDAWNIQTKIGGVPTGLISLPLRYMHTSVEEISLNTLKNCAKVIAGAAMSIGADWEEKLCLDD